MIERTHVEDGFAPSIDSIRRKYESGNYSHEVDPTIATLLSLVDELWALVIESQRLTQEALQGWAKEKTDHGELRGMFEENNVIS